MAGHGGPLKAPEQAARLSEPRLAAIRPARTAIVLCALLACASHAAGDDPEMRLRLTWGDGPPRHWSGTLSLSEGRFSEIQHLGYEANAPTAIVRLGNTLHLRQPAAVTFDGIDVRVTGPQDANLTIRLRPDRDDQAARTVTIPLAQFAQDSQHRVIRPLDDRGNRLIARRAPGDRLRVVFDRESLLFGPGETWEFEVRPHRLGFNPSLSPLRCSLQLLGSRGNAEYWVEQHQVQLNQLGSAETIGPIALKLPTEEGVYELVVSLRERRSASSELLQRRVQLIVVDPQPAPAEQAEWRKLDFDDPKLWERLIRIPQLKPRNTKPGPLNNGRVTVADRLGKSMTELGPGGWQAAPVPVEAVGAPHILEVAYPNDAPQTLGISIIEQSAAGTFGPLTLDSGVDVIESPVSNSPRIEKHRLIFWPRTKNAWVLLTNRHDSLPAAFGKIRVQAGPAHLPTSAAAKGAETGRMLTAYYARPLFPENFSADKAPDPQGSLDDWNTFRDGGQRLIEYLQHVGYDSAIISVARDGGALYPSQLLETTPRYDLGGLFVNGQDARQKDVLELLFRMFDRAGLKLVPAIHLATPLPELEALLQRDHAAATGIELVGQEGVAWVARFGTNRGQAPYYNPLDPRVQNAIRRVINELVDRYSHHPSFAGITLQLDPNTYVQLPGIVWGNDDQTIARFQADTRAQVPGEGDTRFQERAAFFMDKENPGRAAWLKWRSDKLTEFYRAIQRDVSRANLDAKLYLAAAELLASEPIRQELHPRLPFRPNFSDAMLQHGVNVAELNGQPGVVVLRPERLKPLTELAEQAVNLQLRSATGIDALFKGQPSGSLTHHEPMTLALPSFDAVSPFGPANTRTWLAAHISPNAIHNRARFVSSIAALDSQILVDGGRMLPLGQEESIRRMVETYRMLPAAPFETVTPKSPAAQVSPITLRKLTRAGRTYFYIVNDASWPVDVQVELDLPAGASLQRFGSQTPADPIIEGGSRFWKVQLEAYDLAAGYVNAPNAGFVDWSARFDKAIKEELNERVHQVKSRVNGLGKRTSLNVIPNADFEQVDEDGRAAEWEYPAERAGAIVEVDAKQPFNGRHALHMQVTGKQVASARSQPFEPPKTGRISVLVWARTRDAAKQPSLRLAIDDGQTYYRFAPLGLGEGVEKLSTKWERPYLFHLDELPATGIKQLMVRFDLMGKGEVWIDAVQVFDLYFFKPERTELRKNVATAHFDLLADRIVDCEQFLKGYWPRFVIEHVPPPRVAVVDRPVPIRDATQPTEERREGWQRYMPRWPKWKLPFSDDD
jgi:hypothetical protein